MRKAKLLMVVDDNKAMIDVEIKENEAKTDEAVEVRASERSLSLLSPFLAFSVAGVSSFDSTISNILSSESEEESLIVSSEVKTTCSKDTPAVSKLFTCAPPSIFPSLVASIPVFSPMVASSSKSSSRSAPTTSGISLLSTTVDAFEDLSLSFVASVSLNT